jgi:hypothetical protein
LVLFCQEKSYEKLNQIWIPHLDEEMMRLAASNATEDRVIVVDPWDLRKKYTKKIEFLGKVREGRGSEIGEGAPSDKLIDCE